METVDRNEDSWNELKYNDVKSAVETGDDSAKTKLAWLMLSGDERDEDGAVVLLEERAKERDPEAMWMLGLCCEFGIGTEKNVER